MSAVDLEMPRIRSVEGIAGYRLKVIWDSGPRANRVDIVDVGPMVLSFRAYKTLRTDHKLWQSVSRIHFGNAVTWGDDIEMSAASIDRFASESLNSEEFGAFLERCHLTQEAAAHALGRSRRQAASYLAGAPIPRVVALACLAYEERHTPSKPAASVRVAPVPVVPRGTTPAVRMQLHK